MLRSKPPDRDPLQGARASPISISATSTPPGEDGLMRGADGELENTATAAVQGDLLGDDDDPDIDFLQLVREAEQQASLYVAQVNRKAWSQSLRAFHNEHFVGSKYTRADWRGRSKLFVPKTRAAVRKDMASVAASLFNNIDAINCLPGNESDPRQRAAAAVMEELVNYRTDRASGKAAIPWFAIAMGARQDAVLTGICLSKQAWKTEHRKDREEQFTTVNSDGAAVQRVRDVYSLTVDRPDIFLFPSENFVIDPAADWTDPAQSAAFIILKYPMQIEEIRDKQNAPVNPWRTVKEETLKNTVESNKYDMAAIRRAREMGLDRLDETQTGTHFQIIWVYETFVRVGGEDWTFFSIGDKEFLTEPTPVREVYPEQAGDRPLALGYGSLESHRIFPMSAVESWQMLQLETNDLRNLMLDGIKQNVMPITKVRRGRQVDLDQVKRRSSGSSIMVTEPDDVTWETPPQIPQGAVMMGRELDLELDDLAGQQNYGSVETNNALGKTLGGLKLAAGAANAVQEFDIRVWIETWVAPVMSQIVKLEQYYESDPIVLGLCGERAQLLQKHGISKIDDELLEQEVTVRVSVGLGAGDPQQRLAKFQSAVNVVAPLLAQAPEFQSGQREINAEAIIEEVFGAVGYKDGGRRFFRDNGQAKPNPMGDLNQRKLQAEIEKNERMGKASLMSGLAAVAKVALGKRALEADVVDSLLDRQHNATQMGFEHGHKHNDLHLKALDHGHRHGLAIAKHKHQVGQDLRNAAMQAAGGDDEDDGEQGRGDEGSGAPAAPAAPQPDADASGQPQGAPQSPQPQQPSPNDAMMQLLQSGQLEFTRDPKTGRISGVRLAQPQGAPSYPRPAA